MSVPNKPDNSLSNLLYGISLVLFGSFALWVAWTMWRSINNWLILTFALISSAAPDFAAFFLGVRWLDRIYVRGITAYRRLPMPRRPWGQLSDYAPLAAEFELKERP